MESLLVYGSSTAQGHGDVAGGWATRLQGSLRLRTGRHNDEVINRAFRHTFTSNILEYLPHDVERFHRPQRDLRLPLIKLAVLVQPGSDSSYNKHEQRQNVPPAEFVANLRKIGAFCIDQLGGPPLFITMPPLVADFVDANRTFGLNIQARAEYNQYVRQVSEEESYPLVDVERVFEQAMLDSHGDGREYYARDGFHPSELGHILIKDNVLPVAATMCAAIER